MMIMIISIKKIIGNDNKNGFLLYLTIDRLVFFVELALVFLYDNRTLMFFCLSFHQEESLGQYSFLIIKGVEDDEPKIMR